MSSGHRRLRLGEFDCISLRDGHFNYALASLFANLPASEVEEALRRRGMATDQVGTPYTCLLVDTGAHRVMIDTGAGALGAIAAKLFPTVDHGTTVTGELPGNLRESGIEPDEVDTVVVTHAHPDHIGGTLHEDGSLVFANARYVIARGEWEFWMSGSADVAAPAPMVAIARRALEPLRDRVVLIDDGADVVPGVRALAAPGHTPGHLALSIRSAGEELLHISDTALHPLHLEHPEWAPAFDVVPEQAIASKRRMLEHAAREETLVFAHHFAPFPALGRVIASGAGWEWHPIAEATPLQHAGEGPRVTA